MVNSSPEQPKVHRVSPFVRSRTTTTTWPRTRHSHSHHTELLLSGPEEGQIRGFHLKLLSIWIRIIICSNDDGFVWWFCEIVSSVARDKSNHRNSRTVCSAVSLFHNDVDDDGVYVLNHDDCIYDFYIHSNESVVSRSDCPDMVCLFTVNHTVKHI